MSWLNFVIKFLFNNDHLSALEKGVGFAPTNREPNTCMSLTLSSMIRTYHNHTLQTNSDIVIRAADKGSAAIAILCKQLRQ